MKLDSRIIEGKKPLDCFDVDIAKQFIGKKGYFSHYVDNYADLKLNTVLGILESTGETFHESFCCTEETFDNYYYEFFLPAEWVKEPKKKYRPYTKHEFLNKFECGKPVNIRRKDDYINFFIETIPSVKIDNLSDDVHVRLFEGIFNLKRLFDEFEWQKSNGEWQPFGVIDEQGVRK